MYTTLFHTIPLTRPQLHHTIPNHKWYWHNCTLCFPPRESGRHPELGLNFLSTQFRTRKAWHQTDKGFSICKKNVFWLFWSTCPSFSPVSCRPKWLDLVVVGEGWKRSDAKLIFVEIVIWGLTEGWPIPPGTLHHLTTPSKIPLPTPPLHSSSSLYASPTTEMSNDPKCNIWNFHNSYPPHTTGMKIGNTNICINKYQNAKYKYLHHQIP